MVSFQCHGCGDVIKKPKLDQHRMKCHTGYDCIDCSKTFNTPAEYKGHTSCISEAEKYQKSLYKGPKTGAGASTVPAKDSQPAPISKPVVAERASNAQWYHPPATGNNGHENRNGRGYGCGYGCWGKRTNTTGANDTPLGTNARNSPAVQPTAVVEEKKVEVPQAKEQKNDKKRKSVITEEKTESSSKKTKLSEQPSGGETPAITASTSDDSTKEKKSKKDKKAKDSEKNEKKKSKKDEADVEMAGPEDEKEKKKDKKDKKKKEKKEKTKEEITVVEEAKEEAKSDKKRKRKEEGDPDVKEKKKEKKKEKAPVDAAEEDSTKEKKHKKEKKSKSLPTAISVS